MDESAPRCPRCNSEYVLEKGGDGKATECRRCGFKGPTQEFASKDRLPVATAANAPVFCLERRRGLVGGLFGLGAGLVVTIFFGDKLGGSALALGTVVGVVFGRLLKYWVCSEPTCRAPVRPDDHSCARCNRPLRGIIIHEEDHFVRIAEWKREQ